jgi:hypothetical protein
MRAGGVPDCEADVLVPLGFCGIDIRECVAKDVVKIVDPCTPGKLFGGDVNSTSVPSKDVIVAGELGHEPEDECALQARQAPQGRPACTHPVRLGPHSNAEPYERPMGAEGCGHQPRSMRLAAR